MMLWIRAGGEVLGVGVAYAIATSLPALLGKKALETRAAGRTQPGWFMALISGGLFALAVRPVIASLTLSTHSLMLSLWLLLFVLGFLLSMIEAVAFSEGPSPIRMGHVGGAMVAAAAAAVAAGFLIKPPTSGSLVTNLEAWVDRFGWTNLAIRVVGTAVAFMVAYCVIGSVAWYFVRPYYTDPKFGLRLRVPRGPVIILLQLGRGLLAVLALAPLIASSSAQGFDWWRRFSIALAVTSGVIPILGAAGWPRYLRVVHGLEIVVFALVYAFALWKILGV